MNYDSNLNMDLSHLTDEQLREMAERARLLNYGDLTDEETAAVVQYGRLLSTGSRWGLINPPEFAHVQPALDSPLQNETRSLATVRRAYSYSRRTDRIRDANLKQHHGTDLKTVTQQFVQQGQSCAICSAKQASRTGDDKWVTDVGADGRIHVLCRRCSRAVSSLKTVMEDGFVQELVAYMGWAPSGS